MIYQPSTEIWTPSRPPVPPSGGIVLPGPRDCRETLRTMPAYVGTRRAFHKRGDQGTPGPGGGGGSPLGGLDLTGLAAYWKLDEASGTRNDSHGSNHLNLNSGSDPINAAGIISNAVAFTASSLYLGITDNAALSMGDIDFSIWGWIYPTSASAGSVLGKFGASGSFEYKIDISSWPNLRFLVSSNGTSTSSRTASGVLATDTWFFFCARHDSVNNLLRFRTNTTDVADLSYSSGVFDGSADFRIGKTVGDTQGMVGRADEIGIIKRFLSDAEVTALYNSGAGVTY